MKVEVRSQIPAGEKIAVAFDRLPLVKASRVSVTTRIMSTLTTVDNTSGIGSMCGPSEAQSIAYISSARSGDRKGRKSGSAPRNTLNFKLDPSQKEEKPRSNSGWFLVDESLNRVIS